ncbi:MAG: substrate-binding domain-containing protein [Firmicutes bacterium]|nr:substrate-binding domain-containing protein [Bacillota bacterium]
MKKISLLMVFVVILGLVLSFAVMASSKTIGVSLLTREHQFYRDLEEGLKEKANKYGYELIVTSGDFDLAKQSSQLSDFISRGVDAIIVCPVDSRGIGSSIAQANDAGIPVFTADIANLSDQGKVISHVASDNTQGGRVAGELMIAGLKEKVKLDSDNIQVAIINHPAITSVLDRVKGFKEVMDKYENIEIVADIPAWGQRANAMAVMEDLLIRIPGLDGVFGINDDSALGAVAALEGAGIINDVVVIGYDATPEAREAIANGKIYGDAMQNPKVIGETTIDAINKHFNGQSVDSLIPVEVGPYTK